MQGIRVLLFYYQPSFSLGLSVWLFIPTTLPTPTSTPTPPPLPLLPPLSTLYSRRRTPLAPQASFSSPRKLGFCDKPSLPLSPGLPPSLPFLEFSRLINRPNRFIALVSLDLNKPAEEGHSIFYPGNVIWSVFSII